MRIYNHKELRKVFSSRLRTQRRVYTFDKKQILILPFLEHCNGIDTSIDNIRFLIKSDGTFIEFKKIKELNFCSNSVIILSDENKKYKLHHRTVNGEIKEIILNSDNIKELTIEHSPSIYIVLLTHYIKKTESFNKLTTYTKTLGDDLTSKEVKMKNFSNTAKINLENHPLRESIKSAFVNIFQDITLEILHTKNNDSNLSIDSLNYYFNSTFSSLNKNDY